MSQNDIDIEKQREELAQAYGRERDPNAELAKVIEGTEVDPIGLFFAERVETQDLRESTINSYRTAFRHWKEHMGEVERHPAFPNEDHVKGFIQYLREDKGNGVETTKRKLRYINSAYEYWQVESLFPHDQDYNPIEIARKKTDLSSTDTKEMPRIPLEELREIVGEVDHRQNKAIIVTQLKLGMRAGEVRNMQIQDLNIGHKHIRENYPQLGTHPQVEDRPNSIYIPDRTEREGNKSRESRVLPLDDEMRRVLVDYLLVRPAGNRESDGGVPWVFLTKGNNVQIKVETPSRIWKKAFHPEYAETDSQRGVGSHFGRHYFTTHWRVAHDMNEELVEYMRGDRKNKKKGIDHYLHTYYSDIEEVYRDKIYQLEP